MYNDIDTVKLTRGQERGLQFILDAWEDDVVPAVIVGVASGKTLMVSELTRRLKGYHGDIVYVSMTTDLAGMLAPNGVEYISISKLAERTKYGIPYGYACKIVILDEFYQYDEKVEPLDVLDRLRAAGSTVVILSSRPKRMVVPDYVRLYTAATWEWTHRDNYLKEHVEDFLEAIRRKQEAQFTRDFGLIDSSVPIYQLVNGSYLGRLPRPSFWKRVKTKLVRLVK